MALREDYHTPCIEEINRRIGLIDNIIGDIKPYNYKAKLGLENSSHEEKIENVLDDIVKKLEKMQEVLISERKKIAYDTSDVRG